MDGLSKCGATHLSLWWAGMNSDFMLSLFPTQGLPSSSRGWRCFVCLFLFTVSGVATRGWRLFVMWRTDPKRHKFCIKMHPVLKSPESGTWRVHSGLNWNMNRVGRETTPQPKLSTKPAMQCTVIPMPSPILVNLQHCLTKLPAFFQQRKSHKSRQAILKMNDNKATFPWECNSFKTVETILQVLTSMHAWVSCTHFMMSLCVNCMTYDVPYESYFLSPDYHFY